MGKTMVAISMTEEEKKEIKKKAKDCGLTMSSYVRFILKNHEKAMIK